MIERFNMEAKFNMEFDDSIMEIEEENIDIGALLRSDKIQIKDLKFNMRHESTGEYLAFEEEISQDLICGIIEGLTGDA